MKSTQKISNHDQCLLTECSLLQGLFTVDLNFRWALISTTKPMASGGSTIKNIIANWNEMKERARKNKKTRRKEVRLLDSNQEYRYKIEKNMVEEYKIESYVPFAM